MKFITNPFKITKYWCGFFVIFFLGTIAVHSQNPPNDTPQDTTQVGIALGQILLKNPNSIVLKYKYDPLLDRYVYSESVAGFISNIHLYFLGNNMRI